jgi:hypothetical protein
VWRRWACLAAMLVLGGCGGGTKHHAQQREAAPPAAPLSARALTLSGRIVIANGWQGVVTGQRLRVAAGRYASGGGGVALITDDAGLEREVRAPHGEGELRVLHRIGRGLALRSHRGNRFTLDLRTLVLERQSGCPSGALRARRPSLSLRDTRDGLRPLPTPRSDAFAVLIAIMANVDGNVERIDVAPAGHAPCGLTQRTVAADVWVTTPRPIVSVLRETFYLSRFSRGWRAWRIER